MVLLQPWTRILQYKQVRQRSPEWYEIRSKYVTGSDFASLVPLTDLYLKHYYNYFNIALDTTYKKTKYGFIKTLKEWYGSRLKVNNGGESSNFGAFSAAAHGILFEDVVLNIVAQKSNAFAKPLGLIVCPHHDYCAISPDGLLCFNDGRAMSLELKCITTRKITNSHIPFSYFMQTEFAAWQLGCSHGIYCEADIMQVSELYWYANYRNDQAIAFVHKNGFYPYGLILKHVKTNTYKIPNQCIRTPSQFFMWRDHMIGDDVDAWQTMYYKVNEIQLLTIPVRENFEDLFSPIIKKHHDTLMSYTKSPDDFFIDFPASQNKSNNKKEEKGESLENSKKREKENWLDHYLGDKLSDGSFDSIA